MEKFEGGSDNINVFSPGQRYLVLDAGGKNFGSLRVINCNLKYLLDYNILYNSQET